MDRKTLWGWAAVIVGLALLAYGLIGLILFFINK